jgi:hypothetical protein
MKYLITLSFFLVLSSLLFAQKNKDLPDFGKVEKSDLLLKECEFDKNAEALVLFDFGESIFKINTIDYFAETNHHTRIKIFNAKGYSNADIHIRYANDNNMKPISHIQAQTYNLDAAGNIVITKVEKSQIFDKKISKRFSEIVFTFPEVKPGSIIEYKYTDNDATLDDWYFQRDIPVQVSEFKVDYPAEFYVRASPHCVLPLDIKGDPRSVGLNKTYTMKNIPALRDEPEISCARDYMQHLELVLVSVNFPGTPARNVLPSWPKIIKSLMDDEDFGVQLKKNIPRTSDLEEMLKNISNPYDKMVIIHHYVRKNMEWNGTENIWALSGVKSAWKDKKGTSGEINLILVNLLKDAGLNAHPVLVSTREHGRINGVNPSYSQFNKVMAYVTIDDNPYVLDATEKYTPSQLIPWEVVGTEGLVIEKIETGEWGWKTLWNPNQKFNNTTILMANIDKEGKLEGNATIYSSDYARMKHIPKVKDGKEKYIETFFASQNSNAKIDSLVFENENTDSLPLVQKFNFSLPTSTSGDYQYFSSNLFTGLEKNPFLADSRFSDIFFGANQKYSLIGSFNIPEGYAFEELPKNTRMIMPDTGIVFTRLAGVTENTLSVRVTLEFRKPYYMLEEYPEFKEFYKKLYGLLTEQFVIKKKANP